MKNEVKLGILSLIILILFTWMMIELGDIKFTKNTYLVPITFPYVGGLDVKSSVRLAGVKIGEVKEIELRDGVPHVIIEIDKSIHIKKDAEITINTLGFIGSNYIEIGSGTPDSEAYGEVFTESLKGEAPLNIGDIMNLIGDASQKFNEIGDSITELSKEIQGILQDNKENLSSTIDNLAELSEASKNLIYKLDSLSGQLNQTAENLNKFYSENKDTLQSTFTNIDKLVEELQETSSFLREISQKIEMGEGSLGKVITDDKLYNDINNLVLKSNNMLEKVTSIKTFWEYEGLYNESDEIVDSKIGLKIEPGSNNSYFIAVSNLGKDDEDINLDLLLNYKLSRLTLFGGLIESSAGFGVVFELSPSINLFFKGLNFEREELGPNLRAGLSLRLFKGFDIYAEGNDLIEDPYYRAGIKLSLEDENIKYIFGFLGLTAN